MCLSLCLDYEFWYQLLMSSACLNVFCLSWCLLLVLMSSDYLNVFCLSWCLLPILMSSVCLNVFCLSYIVKLLTCGEDLHDRMISLRMEVWTLKTGWTHPLFIEVPLQNQESERTFICVLRVSIQISFGSFLLDFGNVLTQSYLLHVIILSWSLNMPFPHGEGGQKHG
jgi:hypothetical protein